MNHLKYDAFGKITAQSDSSKAPLTAFTGQMWAVDSGLFYYDARWYDAAVGRFVSEDPIGFGGGDVNLSRYVGNRPTTLVDPSGLMSVDVNTGPVSDLLSFMLGAGPQPSPFATPWLDPVVVEGGTAIALVQAPPDTGAQTAARQIRHREPTDERH